MKDLRLAERLSTDVYQTTLNYLFLVHCGGSRSFSLSRWRENRSSLGCIRILFDALSLP
jgi:hypothetical protein